VTGDGLLAGAARHEHVWVFVRTDADWWDGDEEDIYECACGARDVRYIPR
jgi:hypothetical protein